MKIFLSILWCFLMVHSFAQKSRIIQTTVVNFSKTPLEDVNAYLYTTIDSNLKSIQLSNKKGQISFTLEASVHYYCVISKDSFVQKHFSIDSVRTSLPDTIVLDRLFKNAETAVVYASPIIIKEDTIQFSSEMFKKDSLKTLEEILLKFPGVTIDREGNIEIHGVKVSEILLEGKPLPFNDLKQLTQTLQAAAIDKIQFIDRKSEETRISKIDDGKRDKVINIKLKSKTKRSLNQGYYMGLGNNSRIEARANANFMYNDFYSNGTVNFNNTGRNNFNNISFFNPNGITQGLSTSLNFRISSNKKLTIGANFGFSNQTTELNQIRDRVIFLKDSLNYFNQEANSLNRSNNFTINSDINFIPDTLGEWRIRLNSSFGTTKNDRTEIFNTKSHSIQLLNNGLRNNDGSTNRYNVGFNLNGGRRNKKNSISFMANASMSVSNSFDETFQVNDIQYFRSTGIGYDTANQRISNDNTTRSFNLNLSSSIKIYKDLRISIGSSIQYTNRPITRNAYFLNFSTGKYELPNTALLNDVINLTNTFSQKIGLYYELKEHSWSIGVNRNQQLNESKDIYRDTIIEQKNKFYTPYFTYNYNSKKLLISNSLSVSQRTPTSQELQPIVDNSNPLFIRKGNPDLKNQQTISVATSLQKKQTNKNKNAKSLNYSLNNNFTIITNKIANNTFFDVEEGKQTSKPINLPQIYNNNLSANINKYFDKLKMNLYHRMNWNMGKDNNFLNGELNNLFNNSIRPAIGVKIIRKKYEFDYNIGYLHQTNEYSLRPNQNITIGNFTTDLNFTLFLYKHLEFRMDYQQTVNNNKRSIQRINNLNGKLEYIVQWKKLKPRIAFQAFDILNQNNNLQQNINDYYEETVFTNAIRKFYLISIQVQINQFKAGGKKI